MLLSIFSDIFQRKFFIPQFRDHQQTRIVRVGTMIFPLFTIYLFNCHGIWTLLIAPSLPLSFYFSPPPLPLARFFSTPLLLLLLMLHYTFNPLFRITSAADTHSVPLFNGGWTLIHDDKVNSIESEWRGNTTPPASIMLSRTQNTEINSSVYHKENKERENVCCSL